MAKKVVASLQTAGKSFAKVIKMDRSSKTGAYVFKEEVIPDDKVKEFFKNK
ncbi:MAG: DUF4295 domain-containing protein [Bacteroidales bacterium]